MPPRSLLAPLLCLCLALAATPASSQQSEAEQLLTAAEAAVNVGDDRKAEGLIAQVPAGSLGVPEMARAQIVRAEIAIRRGQLQGVLQALPSGSDHVPQYAERIEALRASALYATGEPVAATRSLVQREKYLRGDQPTIQANRDTIWTGLLQTPLPADVSPQIAAQDAPGTDGSGESPVMVRAVPRRATTCEWLADVLLT
jgi:outer membrane PBP1 activator LpoA protein